MGLQFHPPDTLVQAAIEIDTSLLKSDPSAITQSEAFHVVEKTPERNTGSPPAPKSPRDSSPEHSPPIVPRRRVTTRVEPTKTAPEPPADSSDREGTPPIKVPMRRATARRATATEDRSSATPPRELTPPPAVIDDDTPMDFRRLPKRRAGTASVEATPAKRARSVGPSHIDDSLKEPPLKKFRALFDSTAPGEMESGAIQEESESQMFQETNFDDGFHSKMSTTQTETQTQSGRTQRRGGRAQTITSLSALREEEEEESMVLGTQQRKKRTLEDVNEDVEMEDATGPTSKRQATETNRVVSGGVGVGTNLPARASSRPPVSKTKPPSTATVSIKSPSKNKGAAVGKPDKDEAFLKALASTKRGKKREDEFDREFNRLKISKPDLDAQNGREPEEDWKVLADFGDDSGIRGNFMTICELEVFKEKNGRNAKSAGEMRPEWEGKPNFKKFKRKNVPRSGAKVELFVDNQKDGLGPSYWKDGDSSQPMTQSKPKPRARSKALAALDEEVSAPEEEVMEVEDSPPPVRKGRTRSGSKPPSTSRSKPPSRAGSATPAPTRSSRRGKAVASIPEDEEPLFLDDDSQSQSQSQFQSQSQTMGRRSGRGGRGSNRSETLDEEEEDDFETLDSAFDRKGTRGKPSSSKPPSKTTTTTRTRARKAPVVLLDDSDDDAVFKGF
ncbi:hypothetical protein CC1G_15803 [Coprinopsis cinerea okayama7|uniref:Uncharacterized protein n=1 Tax=Coprinopsis cinerea (strain Okayama-7 / 130 / ATCC MYA-4618 / FGSC 9003) TaxID=240176 RepID=D6RR06_COPC7|nr:hypothetical protein CC1G_15803 [Coprinopsis cinerea okayama7\|eukprot:XP_002910083.1 hypothetical protein CC1G_15803 [Coprinopsis cinerea okayama7\